MAHFRSFNMSFLLIRGECVRAFFFFFHVQALNCTQLRFSEVMQLNFLSLPHFTECVSSQLQKPHESLTTHIKQLDRQRGCVVCSIKVLAAT